MKIKIQFLKNKVLILLLLLFILLSGFTCKSAAKKSVIDKEQENTESEENMSTQEEIVRTYEAWKKLTETPPFYSKSTAYTNTPEFKAIIDLGQNAIPFLTRKLIENHGTDFYLADAVIVIMQWNPEDFSQTEILKKRDAVLKRLKKEDNN